MNHSEPATATAVPATGRLPAPTAQPPVLAPAGARWSPARLAYAFYGVAAAGAVIGQTWVAVLHVPWPEAVPPAVRVAAVLPFTTCLELLAMALAAMADERMRHGERAYGFRSFSALVAALAVGIQVAGHWPHIYWSIGFGVLSTSAYLLWLLHAGARRRDALRAAGNLPAPAPDYGWWRRLRQPAVTARAAELARIGHTDPRTGTWRPLGLYESLDAAEQAIRNEKRRPAIAHAVEQLVRAGHQDDHLATIAVTTIDLDRLAGELTDRIDYRAWTDRLAAAVTTPPATAAPTTTSVTATPAPTTRKRTDAGPATVMEHREPQHLIDLNGSLQPATGIVQSQVPAEDVPAPADPVSIADDDGGPPEDTAGAVAYWLRHDPALTPSEIAAKIGKTVRTVRRNLPANRPNDEKATPSGAY